MKTIKPGTKPLTEPVNPNWWVGVVVNCGYCGFSGEMEEGDDGTTMMSPTVINRYFVYLDCPTCGHQAKAMVEPDEYLRRAGLATNNPPSVTPTFDPGVWRSDTRDRHT